jgi:excisionase family DNA binding protein
MARNEQNRAGCRLLTLKQAAEYLGVSAWTVRRLVWRGDLPHVPIGRLVQLDRVDLDHWIEEKKARFGASKVQAGQI